MALFFKTHYNICIGSDSGVAQSQDDSIVGTKQCRHSVAIMPIPGSLSSSSPDLLQPAASALDFTNPSGKTSQQTQKYTPVHVL